MDSWVLVLLWIITFIMAILSIVLLTGRGSGLIAGYNMSSDKEKAKYNEKKLCRVMGIGLSVITLTLAFSLYFQFIFTNLIINHNFIVGMFHGGF